MAADALLKKIDALDGPLGRRLSDVSGNVDYGGMVRAPETQQRDWLSTLGGGRGINWGAAATSGGGRTAGWLESIKSGGGLPWAGMAAGRPVGGNFNLSGFDDYNRLKGQREAEEERKRQEIGQPGPRLTDPAGAQGSWGVHEAQRDLLTRIAKEYGLDPDEVAAFALIETGHLSADQAPNATSSAGAMGLLQVMPFHFQPGQNGYDPETNVRVGLAYYKQMRDKFGPGLAAAAYHGGPGAIVNGKARTDNSDGHMTSAEYEAAWRANYARIKSSAPKQPATATSVGTGLASLFGGQGFGTSQGFGRTGYSTGPGASVYDFGTEYGLDGDTHTGWDIASPRGTQFYMPAGLNGTVTIAGGSGYYRTDSGDGPGKGELRIALDNGYELILGHNDRINVQVGQKVTAGMLLGLTGSSDGDHLHIEVRRRNPNTRSGWEIVDPAVLFGGGAGGNSGQYTP